MRIPVWLLLSAALVVSPAAADVQRNLVARVRPPALSNSGRFQLQPGPAQRVKLGDTPPSASILTPQSIASGSRILYAPAEDDDPVYRGMIAARTGATVDYFDAATGTPSAAEFSTYDCVYTWVNTSYADPGTFGDRLADYVDAGGTVILGSFCTYRLMNALAGRIMTASYSPVYSPTGDNHYTFAGYARDGATCLYQGISDLAFGTYVRDTLALQGSGRVDGHYRDGEIAAAYRPDKKVIYINGCGATQLGEETNGAQENFANLVGNAFLCSRPASTPPASHALYASNRAGQLFWIDVTTGHGTYVGNLPTFSGARGAGEIKFNKLSGRAYVQARDGVRLLQPFDPTSGAALGPPVPDGATFSALEFVNDTLYGASIPDTCPALAGNSVLVAAAEDDDPIYRANISAQLGGRRVDYFDARLGTPTREQLQGYDAVYTWADFSFASNVLFGDRLADFVDAGGKAILGVFCTYSHGNYLDGLIMGAGYCPVVSPGGNHQAFSSYLGGGTSCIHAGVWPGSYGDLYRDSLALRGGGTQDGTYGDGEIAHAYRSDMRVIYSNGSGNTQLGGNAGWDHVIANATNCAPPQPVSKLRRLDPATGSSVVIGSTGVGAVAGLAYHAASRTLYGITGFEGRHSRLVKLNVATGAATVVGDAGFEAGSLAFGPDGYLYAGGAGLNGGYLYRLNLATGAGTRVGLTCLGNVTGLMRVEINGVGVGDDGATPTLELAGIAPNPATRGFRVSFTLPSSGTATLELVDLAGRRLERYQVGAFGAGRHTVDMGRGRRLAPGVYLVRLSQGRGTQSRKVCVISA